MASTSLSPKRAAERMRQHRHAVMVLAMQSAKAAVLAQICAEGQKIGQFSAKEIRQIQQDYFAANMEQLITKAVTDIATSPLFAYLRTNAQKENEPKSITCCADVRCEMTTIGYARVNTDGQTLDAQQAALQAAGCAKVFAEKQSGAKTDRQQPAKAIAALTAGDAVVVCKLDRLARSTRDLLNTLAAIANAGASFRSLGDPWCDTTTPHGRLMLTVLGGLAEFERHLILARTSEGRQRAQQRGVRFGRKPSLTKHQRQEALARRAAGETCVDIARSYAVSHSTISRLA